MRYSTTNNKIRKIFELTQKNELEIKNLQNNHIKIDTINFKNNIYIYETAWLDWRTANSSSENFTRLIKLVDFPKKYIPFITVNLIMKTIESEDGIVNSEYIKQTDDLLVPESWKYNYTIRKIPFSDEENSTDNYYLISTIWFSSLDTLPFDYKEVLIINNPSNNAIRNDKQ